MILDNLVENAIEHTAPGTTVVVELGADARRRHASPSSTPGPGLEPGEEERVFERFFRGSSRAERPRGSGLGLTIVRVLAAPLGRRGDDRQPARGRRARPMSACRSPRRPARPTTASRLHHRHGGPMTPARRRASWPRSRVLGVVAAFGIGLAANAISGDASACRPSRCARAISSRRRRPDDRGTTTRDDADDHDVDLHLEAADHDRLDDDHDDDARRRPRPSPATTTAAARAAARGGAARAGGDDSGGGRGRGRGRGGDD